MTSIVECQTPCLLLDKQRMMDSVAAVNTHAKKLRVALRPHVKPGKSAKIVARMVDGNTVELALSTLREAEYLARRGYQEFLLTTSCVPSKIPLIARLVEQHTRFCTIVDGVDSLKVLASAAHTHNFLS